MKEEEEQKDVGDVIKDAFVPREYEPPNVKNPNVEHKSELQEIQESINISRDDVGEIEYECNKSSIIVLPMLKTFLFFIILFKSL
jgi:hypothetical protein